MTDSPATPPTWGVPPTMPTAPPGAAPSGAPPSSGRAPRSRPRSWAVVAAALTGALVGGAVAGGVVVALDDDPAPRTITTPAPTDPSRPSTVLERPGDIRAILDTVQPAVVRIDVGGAFGRGGTGTGFIIDPDGVIVTNAHVVAGATRVMVTLNDGDEILGRVVGAAPNFDLAVVEIDRSDLPTVELGDSDALEVGDAVVAIGNALGLSGGTGASVTTGIVSALGRDLRVDTDEVLRGLVQTDAAINPGNSGGPLVDVNGRVIGINTAIANPQESNNVGFAIPISTAKPIIEDLRAGRPPEAAFLGVVTNPVTPSIVDQKDLAVSKGALVMADPEPGTPAAKAGIRKDDVIVEIDGTTVERPADVLRAVRRHNPGDTVKIVIQRGEQRIDLDVTLTATDR